MQSTTEPSQTPSRSAARRGKIARLPAAIREELNFRLDDGQEAEEILTWLNSLPEVREATTKYFAGVPVSPQNVSAWRNGGFQEWLFRQQFLDSTSDMRTFLDELQEDINSEYPDDPQRTMADYLASHLAVRMAAFMARWDGSASPEVKILHKMASVILKVQAAVKEMAQSNSIKVAKDSESDDESNIEDVEFTAKPKPAPFRPKIPALHSKS